MYFLMDSSPLVVPLLLMLLTSLVTLDLSCLVILKEFVSLMEHGQEQCHFASVS